MASTSLGVIGRPLVTFSFETKAEADAMQALRENRTASAMGLILLPEGLDRRREQRAQTDAVRQLTEARRRQPSPTHDRPIRFVRLAVYCMLRRMLA
jgi:hypothetical protein